MTVHWPRSVLKPRHALITPAAVTIGGPASLSGVRQVVSSPASVWRITYSEIAVFGAGRLVWRAIEALIEGRATPIILPVFDRDELRPVAAGSSGASHGDGSGHSDGSSYSGSRAQFISQSVQVSRGQSVMTVYRVHGRPIDAGQHFSIGSRLYRVKQIEAVVDNAATISFWPPARETIEPFSEIEVDRPECKVRLMSDDGMGLSLQNGRHGMATVEFIEDPS